MTAELRNFLVEWVESAIEEIEEDMESAANVAKDSMSQYIQFEAGTQKEWESDWTWKQHEQGRLPADRVASIPGRYHTGNITDALSTRVKFGTDGSTIEMGWPDEATEREEYFTKQEHGFRHEDTNEWIEGMFALNVALMAAEEELKKGGAKWKMV